MSPTPTASATPTPEAVEPTCENIATPEYRARAAETEWVSWPMPREGIGHNPFEVFPDGAPAGSISCRWGEDPDLATDNVVDLAWSPIAPDESTDAQTALEADGYERIDASEGVYLAMRGEQGWGDSEGFAQSYLFTRDDVRWAMTKAELEFVQAPEASE
ncbi:hypothetical protein LG299_03340 [Microbacterium lacus]|uniref:hypothetical protein n=1 Tax=Microbacterium lacus TaxID=415217 RepID=UPI00384D9EF2